MKVLVTGGSGYIGSFTTKSLLDKNHEVIVADDLKRGNREALDSRIILEEGDLLDKNFVSLIFKKYKVDCVIHFAGFISMLESMEKPYMYFENNVFGALNLLESMQGLGIDKFIFSSTAGVYGNPEKIPISENQVKHPGNPYGESKLMVENILSWANRINGLNFVVLRYFNAAGAALDGSMGENHDPETHIIPNAINAALSNKEFNLYGTDYNTSDGTCVRDYIHVLDLAEAHILALEKLSKDKGGYFYNVGTGQGYSNKQVLEMIKKISGIDLEIKTRERRSGDADTLIADSSRIKNDLGFNPHYSDLETIVNTAWLWHKRIR